MAVFVENQSRLLPKENVELIISTAPTFVGRDGREMLHFDDMVFDKSKLLLGGFDGIRWPGGRVFYEFEQSVADGNRQRFLNACGEWAAVAKLEFVQRTTEPNFIFVHNSNVNNSQVGMVGGSQDLNLFNWNVHGIIVHEIGHALGLWHEHQRQDRNSFVQYNSQNVIANESHNFDIHNNAITYLPYDFASIMHYGQWAFSSNNNPTLTPLPPFQNQVNWMGQRRFVSTLDGRSMDEHYPSQPNPRGYAEFRRRIDQLQNGDAGINFHDGSLAAQWIGYFANHCLGNPPKRSGYADFRRRLHVAYTFRYDSAQFNEFFTNHPNLDLDTIPSSLSGTPVAEVFNELLWHCVGNPPGERGYREWHRRAAEEILPKANRILNPAISSEKAIQYILQHLVGNLPIIAD